MNKESFRSTHHVTAEGEISAQSIQQLLVVSKLLKISIAEGKEDAFIIDNELIQLLDEAEMNNLSGILIEGGINFKKISQTVITHADKLGVPLFFAPRVVSFLDICREMTNIILEGTLYERYTSSLLKKLVASEGLSRKETLLLVKEANVPTNGLYQVILFTATPVRGSEAATSSPAFDDLVHEIFNSVQKACSTVFHNLNLKTIVYLGASSMAYLIYGETQDELLQILEQMKEIRTQFAQAHRSCRILLSSSSIVTDCTEISRAYQQSMYTSSLMCGGVVTETVYSFEELGSYQLPFIIIDTVLIAGYQNKLPPSHPGTNNFGVLRIGPRYFVVQSSTASNQENFFE